MNRTVILFSTICLFQAISSQTIKIQNDIWREAIVELADSDMNEEDINILIEQLSILIDNPISINHATRNELEQLPFLSDQQIENLLYYRYHYGHFMSLHELKVIEGFDLFMAELLMPFFEIVAKQAVDNSSKSTYISKPKQELLVRFDRNLNRKDGYIPKSDSLLQTNPNRSYLGSPIYNSVRYRFDLKERYRFGFSLEKDAGEPWLTNRFPYYDFASAYFVLRNTGVMKSLTLGNYRLRMGSGLVINHSFSLGKNFIGADLMTRNQGVLPHTSVDEFNYLQGAAAEFQFSNWTIIPFVSFRKLDAIVTDSTIVSIKRDGVHNVWREEEKRGEASLFTTGFNTAYTGSNYRIGMTGVYHQYNKDIEPIPRLYNLHFFRGRETYNLAIDYRARFYTILFAGETAICENGTVATLNAVQFSPLSTFTLFLLHRYYDKSYHALFSRSFSESAEVNNENGFFIQARFKPMKRMEVITSSDLFRFDWPKYGVDQPSNGYDHCFQLSYQPFVKTHIQMRYRLKMKYKNYTNSTIEQLPVASYQRHTSGFQLRHNFTPNLYLRSFCETAFYRFADRPLSTGWLISGVVGYKSNQLPIQLDIQLSHFNTDDSFSKIYLSEKNILYAGGIPSFYGEGVRTTSILKYDFLELFSLWIKVAYTHYLDRETIGSGLEKIDAPSKSDLWIQLRCKF